MELEWGRVASEPTLRYGATVTDRSHSTNKIPSKTTQFKQCVMKSTVRFLNHIGKIDSDRPRL
jgi:hypothetical protein